MDAAANGDGPARLDAWMARNGIDGRLLQFGASCHSVADAAAACGTDPCNIVKNIGLIGDEKRFIVAIVTGPARVSRTRVGRALGGARPRLAEVEEVLTHSGFPAGGLPSFGFDATFVVDPAVMARDHVYTGGGSSAALIRITPRALCAASGARVARVRA